MLTPFDAGHATRNGELTSTIAQVAAGLKIKTIVLVGGVDPVVVQRDE